MSETLVKDLPRILHASREKSSIKNYMCAFHRFKLWAQQFLELSYLPASNKGSLFILSLLQSGKSFSVIKSNVAAIAWFHYICQVCRIPQSLKWLVL